MPSTLYRMQAAKCAEKQQRLTARKSASGTYARKCFGGLSPIRLMPINKPSGFGEKQFALATSPSRADTVS